jgi:hypothetical protein
VVRGIHIALLALLLGALGALAGGALGSDTSAAGPLVVRSGSVRLVATETSSGLLVRAIGAGKVSFSATGGLRPRAVARSTVRLDGVSLGSARSSLRLVARIPGSARPVTLPLRRRRPTTTTSRTTTAKTTTTTTTTTVTTPPPPPVTTTTAATTTAPTTTTAPAPPPARGAAAPFAPAAYSVPGGAVTVSTSAGLVTELAKPAHDIVLADGDYNASSPFSNSKGNRVYAAHLGRAVLHAGLTLGGNFGGGGGLIEGLAFDVAGTSNVEDNAIVNVWGAAGVNNTVLDTTFDGHGAVGYAIKVATPEGFTARRIIARNLTSDGISVDSYPTASTFVHPPVLTDLDVANVARPTPKSSDGTSEACVWLGTRATLTRAKLRNCAWMGLWTGFNGVDATYSDIDVDGTPTGIYMEHFTTSSTFRNLHVGTGVRTGVNCEWAAPNWGGKPASVDNVIENSLIESSWVGVYFDEGTTRTIVRDTTFRGQSAAAIDDYKGVGNSYTGNSYGAGTAVSTAHL